MHRAKSIKHVSGNLGQVNEWDVVFERYHMLFCYIATLLSCASFLLGLYTLDIIPTSEYIEAGQTVNYSLLQLPVSI